MAELQDRFRHQLAMEQANTITIDSVEAIKPVTEHMTRMVRGSLSSLTRLRERYVRFTSVKIYILNIMT